MGEDLIRTSLPVFWADTSSSYFHQIFPDSCSFSLTRRVIIRAIIFLDYMLLIAKSAFHILKGALMQI